MSEFDDIESQFIPYIDFCVQRSRLVSVDVLSFGIGVELIAKLENVNAVISISEEQWPENTIEAIPHFIDISNLLLGRDYDVVINFDQIFASCFISLILKESGLVTEGFCLDDSIKHFLEKLNKNALKPNYFINPPIFNLPNEITKLESKINFVETLESAESESVELFLNKRYQSVEELIHPLIKQYPEWLNGWKILSDTYLIQGKDARIPAKNALALNKSDASEHCYYGLILKNAGDLKGAEIAFTDAVNLNPNYAAAHNNLGIIKKELGNVALGIQHFREALRINPSYSDCFSNLLFCLSHYDQIDSESLYQAHLEFGQQYEVAHKLKRPVHRNSNNRERTLKVGFISADFRDHSVSYCLEPLIDYLIDSHELNFYAYYNHTIEDETTRRLIHKFSFWRSVSELSDVALCNQIKSDEIDILIDLSGHTAGNRLTAFAMKPAPIQVSWFGYLATTGLKAMDYYLADRYLAPLNKFDNYFSEKLVQLPVNALFMPCKNAPDVNVLPAIAKGIITFACFNRVSKMSNSTIMQWSRLLKAIPNSKLLLGAISQIDDTNFLIRQFNSNGIPETQLIFKERRGLEDYLALHHEVDICLDTQPSSGITTTFHAAWMGVPTLCINAESLTGRGSMAIMSHLNLKQFIAQDSEDLVRLGCYWTTHLNELQLVRTNLRNQFICSNFTNPQELGQSFVEALNSMWRTWCKREAKKSFSVPLPS